MDHSSEIFDAGMKLELIKCTFCVCFWQGGGNDVFKLNPTAREEMPGLEMMFSERMCALHG